MSSMALRYFMHDDFYHTGNWKNNTFNLIITTADTRQCWGLVNPFPSKKIEIKVMPIPSIDYVRIPPTEVDKATFFRTLRQILREHEPQQYTR